MIRRARYILGPDAAFMPLDKENTLEPALYSIMEDMQEAAKDEGCGVGKLMAQLLSVITVDTDGKTIGEALKNEPMMSPVLTLLLDIPWSSYQPMWPAFGLYAQMAIRRAPANTNHESVDGIMHPEMQQFANALNVAIINGELASLKTLAKAFLEAGPEAVEQSPIGFLTAVFTQAAVADTPEEAEVFFYEAQKVMKKMVFTPQDFDSLLSTRWPLWGMAYLASLKIMAAA